MNGQQFTTMHCGNVVVYDYKNNKNVLVRFVDTGTKIKTTKKVLIGSCRPRLRDPLAKSVFGVGCIGIGSHKAHDGPKDTKAFSIWRAMLRRCYYLPECTAWRDGCTVASEWHNFQVFAEWFEKNYPKDGGSYQLDKDITIPGNKRYSPEACRFVTQQENLAARRFKRDRLEGSELSQDHLGTVADPVPPCRFDAAGLPSHKLGCSTECSIEQVKQSKCKN